MYNNDYFSDYAYDSYEWHSDVYKTDSYNGFADNYYYYESSDASYSGYYRDYLNLDNYDTDSNYSYFPSLLPGDSYSVDYYSATDYYLDGDILNYDYYVSYSGPDGSWYSEGTDYLDLSDYGDYNYCYDDSAIYSQVNLYDYNTIDLEIHGENTYNVLYVEDSLSLSLQGLDVISNDGVALSHIEAITLDSFDYDASPTLSLSESVAENLSQLHWGDLNLLDQDLASGLNQLTSAYGNAVDINANDSVLFVDSLVDNACLNFTDDNWHSLGAADFYGDSYNAYIHDNAANTHAVVLVGSEMSVCA